MKITWRVISREEKQGKRGEKVQGIRSINGRYKIDRGDVKNSIGKGEAKELACRTHGHEIRWKVLLGGRGAIWQRGAKEKNWEKCNNIINT